MKKRKFKIGEKVTGYRENDTGTGEIIKINADYTVDIIWNTGGLENNVPINLIVKEEK